MAVSDFRFLSIPFTWVGMMLALPLFMACSEVHEHLAPAVNPEDSVAMMTSYGVNTLVSDSGVIKYRIVTERWEVNSARQPSRWEFMKGVFFEQFDEKFHVQAYVQADTAWYYDQQRLWKLRGRVNVRTIDGLIYNSDELYWDGMRHEIYSYAYSRLVTPERTLEGTYFRSDENMTHYTVTNSKGSFVSEDIDGNHANENATAESQDTTATPPVVRPVFRRHAASK